MGLQNIEPAYRRTRKYNPVCSQVGLHVDFPSTVLTLAGHGNALAGKQLDGTPLGLVRRGWRVT